MMEGERRKSFEGGGWLRRPRDTQETSSVGLNDPWDHRGREGFRLHVEEKSTVRPG